MEEEADYQLMGSAQVLPPSLVSLSPMPTPSSRRLSSQYWTPSQPVPSSRRMSWVSLQGRLVNAQEASSAKAIGGNLSREEAIGWELFSPVQRFLIVAVIGVAVAESKKNRIISQLKKSVELRDQVLSSMQMKLDCLCEQMSNINNQVGTKANSLPSKGTESLSNDTFGCDKIKFVDCGCWHCDQHQDMFAGLMGNSVVKVSGGEEVLQYKMPYINQVEPDERRMSDLSDWASSVTSTTELQMDSFVIDRDMFSLKKECEEKDATIKELSTIVQSANMAGLKRISELEDIIRRKNTAITKLKKDMMVLEQKLVHLTRLRRPSSDLSVSESRDHPFMLDNIVYDMDSTTSPSSSDSDSPPVKVQTVVHQSLDLVSTTSQQSTPAKPPSSFDLVSTSSQQSTPAKPPSSFDRVSAASHHSTPAKPPSCFDLVSTASQQSTPAKPPSSSYRLKKKHTLSRSASPLKEITTNQKSMGPSSFRPKQQSAGGDHRKIKRRTQSNEASKNRWV